MATIRDQHPSAGLSLDAVVVMANNVGCVCTPAPPPVTGARAGSASGGMATILLQEQAARAAQARRK